MQDASAPQRCQVAAGVDSPLVTEWAALEKVNLDTCAAASDISPDRECGSPLQVFLWPIPGRVAAVGMHETVHAEFVSADAESHWQVHLGDAVACTTPCRQ